MEDELLILIPLFIALLYALTSYIDHLPERAFAYKGVIEEVIADGERMLREEA